MKTVKLLLGTILFSLLFTSCYTDVYVEDIPPTQNYNLEEVLQTYELWYVDVEQTTGNGNIPFMHKAFTLSFDRGSVYANNNLVGIGDIGNGKGISVGYYDVFDYELDISHDIDGFYSFEVSTISSRTIELYHRPSNTSFILEGHQRNSFDYDRLFYDNVHYFLQEYVAWEKIFTSQEGAINEFDEENYLQFLPVGSSGNFKSSQDQIGTGIANVYWDYSGVYGVQNVNGNSYLKVLTLDYDYFEDEYFELNILNDSTIELYHNASGTLYRFQGKGYMPYKNAGEGKTREKLGVIEQSIESLKKIDTI